MEGVIGGETKIEFLNNKIPKIILTYENTKLETFERETNTKKYKIPLKYNFIPQPNQIIQHTLFTDLNSSTSHKKYNIDNDFHPLEQIVKKIWRQLNNHRIKINYDVLLDNIKNQLSNNEYISIQNTKILKQSFSKVLSKKGFVLQSQAHRIYSDKEYLPKTQKVYFRNLSNESNCLIYNSKIIPDKINKKIEDVIEGGRFSSSSFLLVKKSKTPFFIASKPEKSFVKHMEASTNVEWYIKFKDNDDFSILYTEKIENSKREYKKRKFNPDFLVSLKQKLYIIEVKANDDISLINYRKLKAAKLYNEKSKVLIIMASPDDFEELLLNKVVETTFEKKLEQEYE